MAFSENRSARLHPKEETGSTCITPGIRMIFWLSLLRQRIVHAKSIQASVSASNVRRPLGSVLRRRSEPGGRLDARAWGAALRAPCRAEAAALPEGAGLEAPAARSSETMILTAIRSSSASSP